MSGGAILGSTVLTDSRLRRGGSAVVWEDGRILFVGSDAIASDLATARGLDLHDGRDTTCIPGLVDAHAHLAALGLARLTTDVAPATTVEQVVDLIAEGQGADDELLLARGLDESSLAERRPPTRDELDAAFGDRPVIIDDRGLHYVVANTAAFRVLGFDSGEQWPNGRVPEADSGPVRAAVGARFTDDRRRRALRIACRALADTGVTSVHAIEGGALFDDRDIPIILDIGDDLPIDVVLFWNTTDVDAVVSAGLQRMGGDICVDGSLGSRTAWLESPYDDAPGTTGTRLLDAVRIRSLIRAAESSDVQIAFHAIGDAAVGALLEAFEATGISGAGLRHRIEHCGVVGAGHLDRAAAADLVISTQPAFPYLRAGPGSVYEQRLGPERAARAYPLADMAASGATIAGGTDAPVTPADGIGGIHACLNHPDPGQRIPLTTAIEWFTTAGARAVGRDDAGTLGVGSPADLVMLGSDLRSVPPGSIADVEVELTISRGRVAGGRRADPPDDIQRTERTR